MNWQRLNELDLDNIGQWPGAAKIAVLALVCALLAGGLGYAVIGGSLSRLEQSRAEELQLSTAFEEKARLAAGLGAHRAQLVALQAQLAAQLRSLPTSLEIAGLLDDISFIATDNGLRLERIHWEAERPGEFATELPMRIIVRGDYHRLGHFVADMAALPRIVIIDSFSLSRTEAAPLSLSMVAKTYQYHGTEAP